MGWCLMCGCVCLLVAFVFFAFDIVINRIYDEG